MSTHALRVSRLSYRYPDGTAALIDVSFEVAAGESVALVGANGAGKSTLLLHLSGLWPPASGAIQIGDVPSRPDTLVEVRKRVGLVFQDPDDQLFMPTVRDDVAFGPANQGLSPIEVDERVTEALAWVGAEALRDRPPYRLSFGEKRAVAIATVLAMRPDILVMDEPSSNLDPRSRRRLIELLVSLPQTRIIATHDLDMAVDLCSRTLVLDHGRVIADGPSLQLFGNEELLSRCQLELPPSMRPCPVCGQPASHVHEPKPPTA